MLRCRIRDGRLYGRCISRPPRRRRHRTPGPDHHRQRAAPALSRSRHGRQTDVDPRARDRRPRPHLRSHRARVHRATIVSLHSTCADMATRPGVRKRAYLVEDHVKDLTAVIQELGLRRVTLWGNSTGGRVVQVYAGSIPAVERVISEDVGPERPEDISDNFARRVAREANGWASEDELARGADEAGSPHPRSDPAQPTCASAPSAVTTDASSGSATQTS